MTDPASLRIIAGWCANLSELCRHAEGAKPTKEKIAVYATMLAEDFPSSAFTPQSLHHVVQGCEWFPAYEVIRRGVGEWWRDNRPKLPAISGPVEPGLSELDQSWLRYFQKREAERFVALGDGLGGREHTLRVLRHMSPAAHALVVARTWSGEKLMLNRSGCVW